MMRLSRYSGNSNIGVYAVVNESLGFVAHDAASEFIKDLEVVLGVKPIMTTVAGSYVVGSLVAMNSSGAIVSNLITENEISLMKKEINVVSIDDSVNAAGNNILANDNGAIISPEVSVRAAKVIADVLNVEVVRSEIGGSTTVGSVCKATNKGFVCPTETTDNEFELLKSVLKVDGLRTTVNHGIKYVGAGILANSKGALIGETTTPIEMGKIEDGLNLF